MLYILPWIILLIGFLLIIIFTPKAFNRIQLQRDEALIFPRNHQEDDSGTAVLDYLQSLEGEIAYLRGDLARLTNQKEENDQLRTQIKAHDIKEPPFQTIFEEKRKTGPEMELYKKVYQAYDQGKNVTAIAKELGRGKGEIELILGLRNFGNS